MKKLSMLIRKTFIVAIYCLFSLKCAIAADTEIFYASASSSDVVKPNVMFIIDTSGSMGWDLDGNNTSVHEEKRLTIVKDVMDDLLTDLNGVNAGLMRFSRNDNFQYYGATGGPVLHPVQDIDLPANPVVIKEITLGANDGFEDAGTTMWLTSNQLKFDGASSAFTAVRFTSLKIPQGARITRATVAFTANGDSAGVADFKVYGQLSNSAPELTSAVADISSRTSDITSSSVNWLPANWEDKNSYVTNDLRSVVQEVVDQAGWCGGSDLLLMFEGTGGAERVAYSSEGKAAYNGDEDVSGATIRIEYESTLPETANGCFNGSSYLAVSDPNHDTESTSGVGGNQLDFVTNNILGVGFSGVNIPQGATITNAYLEFTARESNSNSTSTRIYAVDDSTPPMNGTMTSVPSTGLTSASVNWNSIPAWNRDNTYQSPGVTDIVQEIVNRTDWSSGGDIAFILNNMTGSGFNYRKAYSYNGSNGATWKYPKLYIEFDGAYEPGVITLREDLKAAVQSLPADGRTPISDTIAEAGLYFTGGAVTFGSTRYGRQSNRVSHPGSYENGVLNTPSGCTEDNPNSSNCRSETIGGTPTYISPITDSCQANHIVYLTDGEASAHDPRTTAIYNNWTGNTCVGENNDPKNECAIAIAGYLNTNDVSNLDGAQKINTHMIGFSSDADQDLMREMATSGGGGYYSAQTKDELVSVLETIVNSISAVNTTFVTTGVTVNQYNRLTHSEQLYFSLFTPTSNNLWPGNIKRYKLSDGQILDSNDDNAIDALTSEFANDSQSFWSVGADGNDVEAGGVAGQLTNTRTVYSNLVSGDLTNPANRFNNTNISDADLIGASSNIDRRTVIAWTLGYDVAAPGFNPLNPVGTPPHKRMADPLHSQPTVVSYRAGDNESSLIFVGTNDGFLRAFNSSLSSGEEEWSFIPQEFLGNLSSVQKGLVNDHDYYGFDGAISVYIDDANNNGFVDIGSEKAYLYVGMRRGGNSYYAFDISIPNSPELMHIISGSEDVGPEQVANTSNYSLLGQTWSRPIIGRMNIAGEENRLVMLFGGGYDTALDLAGTASASISVGNIVYIADAITGTLLWDSSEAVDPNESEGPLNLNSVPADITAFDLDGDKLIDHFYVADSKAQIFRFDVNNDEQNIKGGRIASLQPATADIANNRHFYYPVDAALINLSSESFISVSIGSGYRAHPLDTSISDRFYMIKDKGVLNGTFDMDVTESDLLNVTDIVGDSDNNGDSDAAEIINDEDDPKDGWYITFSSPGEKVIERSITFNNAVIFTTYVPPSGDSSSCEAAAGGGRVYGLSATDGNPYLDTNFDGAITKNDRAQDLIGAGIAPPPQVLFEKGSEGINQRLCVGTQCGLDDFLPPIPKGIAGYKWLNAKLPE